MKVYLEFDSVEQFERFMQDRKTKPPHKPKIVVDDGDWQHLKRKPPHVEYPYRPDMTPIEEYQQRFMSQMGLNPYKKNSAIVSYLARR